MVEVKRQKFLCLLLVYSANICLSIHMHVAHAHLQLTARPKLIYSNAWPKLGTRDTHATKGDTTVDKNRLGLLPQKKIKTGMSSVHYCKLHPLHGAVSSSFVYQSLCREKYS